MGFFRVRIRRGYVAVILGALSGYYIWNEPLKQYAEKNFAKENLNKVSQDKQFKHFYFLYEIKNLCF